MILKDDTVLLRDFKREDIAKRIEWETEQTEWQLWDGPWEYEGLTEEQKKAFVTVKSVFRLDHLGFECLYVNENSARTYRFPERLEQIVVEGDNLYVMFESCAYAYRASSVNIVDRVLKLSLPKMEAYEEESDSLFSMSE